MRYDITIRHELEDYTVRSIFRIKPVSGTFDSRGGTYQAFFYCCASYNEYENYKNVQKAFTPIITVGSRTAGTDTEVIEITSENVEFEKATDFSGSVQTLWQIDADGDYNVISMVSATSFFKQIR